MLQNAMYAGVYVFGKTESRNTVSDLGGKFKEGPEMLHPIPQPAKKESRPTDELKARERILSPLS
jgi:hypothetical protein